TVLPGLDPRRAGTVAALAGRIGLALALDALLQVGPLRGIGRNGRLQGNRTEDAELHLRKRRQERLAAFSAVGRSAFTRGCAGEGRLECLQKDDEAENQRRQGGQWRPRGPSAP